MNVSRYTPVLVDIPNAVAASMSESAHGGYVWFRDYAALATENLMLREALRQIADDGIERSRDPRTLIALAALKEPLL